MEGRGTSRGFTLIETLVAFTIMAISLGLLFRIHARSAATVGLAEEYLQATQLAQSLLVELPATEDRLSFERTGRVHGKYRWSVHAEPYDSVPEPSQLEKPAYRLRWVSVEIFWSSRGKDRDIELTTLSPLFELQDP